MSPDHGKRPTIAAFLTFLQPGLGHLYLREWLRAAVWIGIRLSTLTLLVVVSPVELATGDIVAAVFGLFIAMENVPFGVALGLLTVTVFATLDAYWIAVRNDRRRRITDTRCPACGRELDESLEFCHWCTTEFDDETEISAPHE